MRIAQLFLPCCKQWGPAGVLAGCLLFLLCARAPAEGERARLPIELQGEVNRAIDRGATYLGATQLPDGSWQQPKGDHRVGYAALPALTLLECGVSPRDPTIQRAANFVRFHCLTLDQTYEIALAILFLDRLGDPVDEGRIRVLALRLIVSQTATGGWGYKCLVMPARDNIDLLTALKRLTPKRPELETVASNPAPTPEKKPPRKPEDLGPGITRGSGNGSLDPLTRDGSKPPLEGTPTGSGSAEGSGSVAPFPSDRPGSSRTTTVPGLDGKPGKKSDASIDDKKPAAPPEKPYILPRKLRIVPVLQDPDAQALLDPQSRDREPLLATTDNSNTQFAILGIWAAQRHGIPIDLCLRLIARRFETSQNDNGSWGYRYRNGGGEPEGAPMTAVGLIGLAIAEGMAEPGANKDRDPRINKGLEALSRHIGTPAGRSTNLPMPNLYLLWSIERVGVLYKVPHIGGKDWYHWGAELLVANQKPDGFWEHGGYHGASIPIDTALALLFLKRANLTEDLSRKLKPREEVVSIDKSLPPLEPPPPPPAELPKTIEADLKPALEAPQEINKSLDAPEQTSAAVAAPEPPPSTEHGSRLWLILLIAGVALVLALGGGGIFLLLHHNAQNKDDEEDDYDDEDEEEF